MLTNCTAGDSQGFNDTYLEALRQQREAQRSVGPDAAELSQQPLPYEVYLKIFGYLSPHDLCRAMRVCKVCGLLYTYHYGLYNYAFHHFVLVLV